MKFIASIIIVAHNSASTIERCLSSILKNSIDNCEILVVDDGSIDETRSIITAKFPTVKLICLNRKYGAGKARNIGVDKSLGEIIIFIDSDVGVLNNTLSLLVRAFDDRRVNAVQSVYSLKCPLDNFASQYQNIYQHYNFQAIKSLRVQAASTYCFAIRQCDFIKFNENIRTTEDGEWGHRIYSSGKSIILRKDILVEHFRYFTVGEVLRRNFIIAKDKVGSIKKYRSQLKTNLSSTHHGPGKVLAVLFSPIPPLCWIFSFSFLLFVYHNVDWKFFIKVLLFHEINCLVILTGMICGVVY